MIVFLSQKHSTRLYYQAQRGFLFFWWGFKGSDKTIPKSIFESLKLCKKYKIKSLVFPALGTGTGGLDMTTSAKILKTELLNNNKKYPSEVIVVLTTKMKFDIFKEEFES